LPCSSTGSRDRLVVNRALVYGVMTVGVVGSFVAVVGLVGATVSPAATSSSRSS
jgi:hypothetical protein